MERNSICKTGNRLNTSLLAWLCILVLLFAGKPVWASGDPGIEDAPVVTKLTGSALAQNATAITSFTTGTQSSYTIKNIITLSVVEETPYCITDSFAVTVRIKIEYGHSATALNTISQQDLKVSYNKERGRKYNAKNYFHFEGAEYVKITVLQITPAVTGNIPINKLLLLQNEIRATRYYGLATNVQPTSFTTTTPAAGADELPVTWAWPVNAGHTHTQLEWSWQQNGYDSIYFVGGVLNTNLMFKNNATRIDLPFDVNTYKIPLLYGGKGRLYCRIRAVNIKRNGSRSDGPWSAPQWQAFTGHNDSLNWQSTISFAEEGKRKALIQYYDGSLRSRQTVTKDNTTNTVVTAETFYDAQGRQAVQVLPVPGITTVMGYTKDLNRFSGQALNENPAKYFDLQPITSTSTLTPAMVTTTGAAKYYSTANAELATGGNKYIPNAEGYPYTVTRYTPDATGRIMAKSAVGINMRMSSGRELKYYYGTAAQEELDGLFGTEVGTNSHYFKNMVKDANGQMSISYVDMHGRTIATALTGNAPTNIIALNRNATDYPNQNASALTRNLLNNNTNVVKNNSIESINTLLVPLTTSYAFRYELNPQTLQLKNCSNAPICYNCLYDLEITISDESGDLEPIIRKFSNVSIAPDDNCNTAIDSFKTDTSLVASNIIQFTQSLLPGSYIIRKTLTLSEASLQKYETVYLAKGLCKTEQQIIDSLKTVLQTVSACNVPPPANTCRACTDSLGTLASYKTRFLSSIGNPTPVPRAIDLEMEASYKKAQLHCERLCNTTSQLIPAKRALMLADMIPYSGQYARDTGTRSMYQKFNIFIEGDTAKRPYYRIPRNRDSTRDFYRNVFNVPDPAIHPDSTLKKLKALSRTEFFQQFTYAWAEALLPYHPEYRRLLFAENNLTATYNWITVFNNTELYDSAVAKGYIPMTQDSMRDPFYIAAPTYKTDMWVKMYSNYRNGFGLYQLAIGNLFCKDLQWPIDKDNCYKQILNTHPVSSLTPDQKNQAWVLFRNLYAAARDSQVNAHIVKSVPLPNNDTLVNQGYRVHFPNSDKQLAQQYGDEWSWYPPTPDDVPDLTRIPGETTAAAVYASRCNGYIQLWKQTLGKCAALAARADKDAILNQIATGMALVCYKASNESHPFGASNVPPDYIEDGSPRSFEEVVYGVLQQYGIDTTELCNPYVIEFPKPYEYKPPREEKLIGSFDACNCSRFQQIRDSAIEAGYYGYSLQTMNDYLRTRYGDTLTASLYNSLNNNCSRIGQTICTDTLVTIAYSCTASLPSCNCTRGTYSPGVCYIKCRQAVCDVVKAIPLAIPQPLPAFMECGYVNTNSNCLSCAQLSSLVAEFKTQMGPPYNQGPVFASSDLTPAHIRNNIIFQKFVNYRTGFQYNWIDYGNAAVANGCNLANYASNTTATQPVICGITTLPSDTAGLALTEPPCQRIINMATAWAHEIYVARKSRVLGEFESQYRARCMAARDFEQFTVAYTTREYHYTLFYYDVAGNLLKTVPPKGVKPNFSKVFTDSVQNARLNNTVVIPAHVLTTNYRYNSLGAIIAQNTPDAGITRLWYDRLGRLVVSRNAQQAVDGKYSYTIFDALSRVTEVGQKPQTTAMTQTISQDSTALHAWLNTNGGVKEQIVFTVYDMPYPPLLGTYMTQRNLRNRISYTGTKNLFTDAEHSTASFYTYDIHGNIDTLLQDYKGIGAMGASNRFKLIAYDYDLISNKVNQVSYQPGQKDAFYHRYNYDAENRLLNVETSRDKIIWERDAAYTYYKHGPLARSELGHLRVQGIDYAYTLHGWLKGVNSTTITNGRFDMGQDGVATGANSVVARDVLGYALHFYDNGSTVRDYKAIGGALPFSWPVSAGIASLYNGNVVALSVNNRALARNTADSILPLAYKYRYDQLNRLVSMQAYKGLDTATNVWTSAAITDYAEAVSYDPNGNIRTYNRKGAPSAGKPLEMDALTYNYNANTNQLNYVQDTVTATNYTEDLDTQASGNYTYDAIGNVKTDVKEGITNIAWNIYGKITGITKTGSSIAYSYDASGNRISKIGQGDTTIYVRDARGNVLSVYERRAAVALQQSEAYLYGGSRLGMLSKQTIAPVSVTLAAGYAPATLTAFTRNEKVFELTNHLGNVLATIGDKKLPHTSNDSTWDYFDADVVTATDYYPFGMTMPGRKYAAANSYRYGYNGKENDNDVKGEGNQQDYGMRVYDTRLGKFLSVDPLYKEYPFYSPYHFAGNSPIANVDLDGAEPRPFITYISVGANIQEVGQEAALLKMMHPGWSDARIMATAAWNVNIEMTHTMLDVLGLVPGLGEIADGVNGGLYLMRGDKVNASLSFAATIPFAGWGATGAKWAGKIIKTSKGGAFLVQFTKNAKGLIEFGERTDLRKVLNLTDPLKEAHHIVPWALQKNNVVQQAAEAGFHMNDLDNGIPMAKYTKELLDGKHSNHPAYNDYVRVQLEAFSNLVGDKLSPQMAKDFLETKLIPDLKNLIQEAEKKTGNLNDFFKKLNGQ